MTECTHEEYLAEIKRIANDEPGWSEPEIVDWFWGWEDDAAD